jgi:malate synthase
LDSKEHDFEIPYFHDYISPSLAQSLLSQSKPVTGVDSLQEVGTRGGLETAESFQFLVELYSELKLDLGRILDQRIVDRKFIDERVKACSEFNKTLKRKVSDKDYKTILGLEDASGRIVFGNKTPFFSSAGGTPIAPIPEFLKGPHVTLFGPPDSAKMSINAMNSYHRKLKNEPAIVETLLASQKFRPMWGADDEDSKTPLRADLISAGENLTACFEKTLSLSEGGKSYELAKDYLALPIKRFPGLALPCTFLFYRGSPIPLHLYDFALHLFKNFNRPEALTFYVPKLENEEEAKYIHKMILVAERLIQKKHADYRLGTVRVMIVLENPRAILRAHEIIDSLYPYFVGASLGWHDYLASTARLFKEDSHYRIPVKADPDIVLKYIKASHVLLSNVVGSRGGIQVGGMYGVLPVDSNVASASFQMTLKGFFKDVIVQLRRNLTGFWVAHPDFVRIGLALVEAWRQHQLGRPSSLRTLVSSYLNEDYQREVLEFIKSPDISGLNPDDPGYVRSLIVADIEESDFISNNNPEEIRYNVFQSLQYLTDWLCGNGCVALPANIAGVSVRVMDDLATAERSRWEVWAELRHGRFSVEEFIKIAHEEMNFIRRNLSNEQKTVQVTWNATTSKWYPVALRLMIHLMTVKNPPEFVSELLLPFTVESIRNSEDPWLAATRLDPDKYKIGWYVERFHNFFEICGNSRFAGQMARSISIDFTAAEAIFKTFTKDEIITAATFHGDIGQKANTLDPQALTEQALVIADDQAVKSQLVEFGNQYIKKFGFKFLVSAKEKSGLEILNLLKMRLTNSLDEEIKNAQMALWEISRLRILEHFPIHLQDRLQELLKKHGVVGASVAINFLDHTQSLPLGQVEKNGHAVTSSTLFELASLSKPLASAFAIEFFYQKGIPLTASVNDLLKANGSPFLLTSKSDSSWADHVQIDHLLNHSALNLHYVSGLDRHKSMPSALETLMNPKKLNLEPIDVIVKPGSSFRYSGGGYIVLEHLIECIEKKSIRELTKPFFTSLGLENLTFHQENLSQKEYASGYFDSGEMVPGGRILFPAFAAGAVGSSLDTAVFLRALSNSYQDVNVRGPISHDTARVMLKGTDKGCRDFMGCDMGLGIFIANAGKNKLAIHQGANEGFRCLFIHCFDGPDFGKGFVLLCNADNRGVLFLSEVAQLIFKELRFSGVNYEQFESLFDFKNLPQEQIVNLGYKKLIFQAFKPLLAEEITSKGPLDPLANYNIATQAKVIGVSDDTFARAGNLISTHLPIFDPTLFGWQGKIMDSWESVRHNYEDFDIIHLRLKEPSKINFVSLSTKYHDGNQPDSAEVLGLDDKSKKWVQIIPNTKLIGHGLIQIRLERLESIYSEVKVKMYPDGGLSRLGLFEHLPAEFEKDFLPLSEARSVRFSEVIPKTLKPLTINYDPKPDEVERNLQKMVSEKEVDYASLAFGGRVISATNEHYGPAAQVISPFPPINMFDGLESARSRKPDHSEEVTIKLGKSTQILRIVLNFQFFVNNNPLFVSIDGFNRSGWSELVKKTKVKAFAANEKEFVLKSLELYDQVRVRVYPDGGINRIRVFGPSTGS